MKVVYLFEIARDLSDIFLVINQGTNSRKSMGSCENLVLTNIGLSKCPEKFNSLLAESCRVTCRVFFSGPAEGILEWGGGGC